MYIPQNSNLFTEPSIPDIQPDDPEAEGEGGENAEATSGADGGTPGPAEDGTSSAGESQFRLIYYILNY